MNRHTLIAAIVIITGPMIASGGNPSLSDPDGYGSIHNDFPLADELDVEVDCPSPGRAVLEHLAGFRLQDSDEATDRNVGFVFRLFIFRELPLRRLGGKLFNTGLGRRRRPQRNKLLGSFGRKTPAHWFEKFIEDRCLSAHEYSLTHMEP